MEDIEHEVTPENIGLIDKILGLPEFGVTDIKQNENDMGFYVETRFPPDVCPKCGCYKPALVIYKTRTQTVRDINAFGKRVALLINRKYYKCKECGGCFAEPLESIDSGGRITQRFRIQLGKEARYERFSDLENRYQISDTTIRNAFLAEVRNLPPSYAMETPHVLGIDEICIKSGGANRKQPWAVIGNGDENTIMDLLQDNKKKTVIAYLHALKSPQNVQVVTMDMWSGYRHAVKEVLPRAFPVIDKYHIVQPVNQHMDFIRKQCMKSAPLGLKRDKWLFLARDSDLNEDSRNSRDAWFEICPLLKKTYDLKEAFCDIYSCKTRREAELYFDDWCMRIPKDNEYNGFRLLIKTISRNAFVEGMNHAIREISNHGFGYDFEVLRGKVLFTVGRDKGIPKVDFNNMKLFTPHLVNEALFRAKYGIKFEAIIEAAKAGLYR